MKKLAALILLSFIGISLAGELDELIKFALENNPRVKSFDNIKNSLSYRENFLRSLPNPRLTFALNNLDTEHYFPTEKNPMSSFGLYLTQKYVLPVKREREAKIASERQVEVLIKKERYEKELVRNIKLLYWDFSYSHEMERIIRGIEQEIHSLIEITEERYRYGKALLSDLLLLKVELLKVRERLADAERLRRTSLERIYALAGGRLELNGGELKVLDFPENFDQGKNVEVKLAKRELEVIKREIDRAGVEHYPDLFLSAGYAIRPNIPNLITFSVGLTLPVWKGKREDMLVLEKKEIYNSKLLELEDVRLKVSGEFEALKESYRITSQILSTVEEEIEEKKKEIEALLIAYEYEKTDIREILRAYRLLWSLEFDRAKLLKELNQIVAKVEALQ
ncbi:outer membrane protein TolC [Hydrogenivirga caldilitoris]|uniref:Outer membrane protein TolC n=1 Tax=Hydrogenivirga caldilitoris TaxID=246264 RepID=A0A497XPX4_9AQUI|nr:TolC family protein [Hydrogenivirga caldilitoris]RLJ70321.1 outer membrane protein TolC [Hydrogenivirga caldilitoris]